MYNLDISVFSQNIISYKIHKKQSLYRCAVSLLTDITFSAT